MKGIEVDVQTIGAAGVLAGAFILGVKWLLTHATNLQKQNEKLVTSWIESQERQAQKLGEIIGQNSVALAQVERVLARVSGERREKP